VNVSLTLIGYCLLYSNVQKFLLSFVLDADIAFGCDVFSIFVPWQCCVLDVLGNVFLVSDVVYLNLALVLLEVKGKVAVVLEVHPRVK